MLAWRHLSYTRIFTRRDVVLIWGQWCHGSSVTGNVMILTAGLRTVEQISLSHSCEIRVGSDSWMWWWKQEAEFKNRTLKQILTRWGSIEQQNVFWEMTCSLLFSQKTLYRRMMINLLLIYYQCSTFSIKSWSHEAIINCDKCSLKVLTVSQKREFHKIYYKTLLLVKCLKKHSEIMFSWLKGYFTHEWKFCHEFITPQVENSV